MTEPIKIVLVEDSAVMRIMMKDLILSCPELELMDTANDGKTGVEKVKKLNPDVVISDLIMPRFDGLFLVKEIMDSTPTPIVMLSSLDKNDDMVFDALDAGAVDFLEKPKDSVLENKETLRENLVRVLTAAKRSGVSNLKLKNTSKNNNNHSFAGTLNYDIIAIGASTGGPSALEQIIQKIPSNISIPIVIAQHMPHNFLESFAKRLDRISPLNVQLIRNNMPIVGGNIYIAPGNSNIEIKKIPGGYAAEYTAKKYDEFNNPSINCLFDSIANTYGKKAIGVILTGMGKDGGDGLKNIQRAGGLTLSQDKSSSVVYGMPKYASDIEASNFQLRLREIPGFIISSLN